MAIRITEDGVVNYENSPDVNRKLFPNLNICGKEINELAEEINGKAPAVFSTAAGSIASFDNGADDMPLKSCVVNIDPIQEGEGDPSPENIRPISGRTGLSVFRRGNNLIDDSIKQIAGTRLFIGGSSNDFPLFLKVGTYTLSCEFLNDVHYGAFYKTADTSNQNIWASTSTTNSSTFTITKDDFYSLWFYSADGVSADNVSNVMLNIGSTALQYEPYKGTTYSVNWETEAGTVYGGTIDVISGKLTVDRAITTIGDLSWSIATTYYRFESTTLKNVIKRPATNTVLVDGLDCSCYTARVPSSTGTNPINYSISVSASGSILIKDESFSNVADFLSGVGDQTISYPLASPVEYQLTPQEIRTLLSVNNIWSDGGDISVEYPADTKTYIDAFSIQTVEVSGQTPTITAEENTRYICGEVTSLTFTPCEKGICDIRFTAASISTVLTLPETVKLPDWFDPTSLEANTTYEINIVDGVYGAVMSWA